MALTKKEILEKLENIKSNIKKEKYLVECTEDYDTFDIESLLEDINDILEY